MKVIVHKNKYSTVVFPATDKGYLKFVKYMHDEDNYRELSEADLIDMKTDADDVGEAEELLRNESLPRCVRRAIEELAADRPTLLREYKEMLRQKEWLEKALKGDVKKAKMLLSMRRSYEYEYWEEIEVEGDLK